LGPPKGKLVSKGANKTVKKHVLSTYPSTYLSIALLSTVFGPPKAKQATKGDEEENICIYLPISVLWPPLSQVSSIKRFRKKMAKKRGD
jgi:hypothetical protein